MMIRSITLTALMFLFMAAIISCKETEEIKRDIIIYPAGSEFTIPVIPSLNSGQVAGNFSASVNVEEEMKKVTGEFGLNNIKKLRLTSFKLELLDTPILENNNLGNFENIQVEIGASGKKALLAKVNDNPPGTNASLLLGGAIPTDSLISILNEPSFQYDIRVKLRKPTTKELKAKVTAIYTITVGF